MRVGIFGGTFDPIHIAHLVLAEQCREQGRLDEVRFLLAARPPVTALGRLEELEAHLSLTPNTGVSRDEVKEVLMQAAIYAGVPAANAAFRIAKDTFEEMSSGER